MARIAETVAGDMIDPKDFRRALACFASGVTVVTAPGDGRGPVGITVSAFTSVSLEPPLILVCLDNRTGAIRRFLEPGSPFAVNILADGQEHVSRDFAGPQTYDLHGHASEPGAGGVPLLADAAAVLECATHAVHDGGDHRIVVGRVEGMRCRAGARPLVYFQGAYRTLRE